VSFKVGAFNDHGAASVFCCERKREENGREIYKTGKSGHHGESDLLLNISAAEGCYHYSEKHINRRKTMKKTIWLAAGVAGMLLGTPAIEARGAVNVQIRALNDHSFVIDSRPSFINLPERGFSVAVGTPYDIVYYDHRYYINQKGSWYRSSSYRGPWKVIREKNLPGKIRRHRLEDIKRYRDTEYSKISNRRTLEQQRSDENNRRVLEQQRSDENNRRVLEQQRSDENNRRVLEQQRSDENNRRVLEQQRHDENRR
jgi:hypothetical protein